ncbi:anti-sigma factor [Subtercola sp. YIM 133946]|uniref:anti-sigma factor n=1 Tax=Subtercola sp. YIM 133946 TaxID=3118909 RepID=UPI002F92F186
MTRDDEYLSSGAYAVNALNDEEARAYERALDESPELRQETDELSATATLLGLAAAPVQPPPSLKASLMAKLAETPQDAPAEPRASTPPIVADRGAAPEVVAAVPIDIAVAARATQQPAAADAQPVDAQPAYAQPAAPESPAAARATARWFTTPVGLLVAAAAAVALFVGGGVVGTSIIPGMSTTSQDASASSLAQIFSASDVQSTQTTVEGGGQATVVWSKSIGSAAIVAQGMPTLASSKTYEAWYINGSTGVATPAGTFVPGGDSTTWHVLSGTMTPGDTIGVTVEPAGGSQTPTTAPILAVTSA